MPYQQNGGAVGSSGATSMVTATVVEMDVGQSTVTVGSGPDEKTAVVGSGPGEKTAVVGSGPGEKTAVVGDDCTACMHADTVMVMMVVVARCRAQGRHVFVL